MVASPSRRICHFRCLEDEVVRVSRLGRDRQWQLSEVYAIG